MNGQYRIVEHIDNITEWQSLVENSDTATWFQTYEAYTFFASLKELMQAFLYAQYNGEKLRSVVVGYIPKEKNPIKQYFSRRAIILGGPLLADDITTDEIEQLLHAVKNHLKHRAIYIETRNFNNYSKYKEAFTRTGFEYKPHLNFHVDCTNWETTEANIGKHRKRYIRLSLKNGATIIENPTIEQVHDYYTILLELYNEKVKTPLYPFVFFEKLYHLNSCKFILIEYQNTIIGGSVCMALSNKAVYEWFACGKDGLYKNIYPSSLTKYAGMLFTSKNGIPIFDMMGAGEPNIPYGVRDFKAEFGGTLVEHGRFIHINNHLLYSIGKMAVNIMKKRK